MPQDDLAVFISHSVKDAPLVSAVIDLLRNALNLPAERIRCTSVPGYTLDAGADTYEQLRAETLNATTFVGLITEANIESAYVLFELGARWGSGRYLALLLGAGAQPEILAGPLSGINSLQCHQPDLLQFVRNIGEEIGSPCTRPEALLPQIANVIDVSESLAQERANLPSKVEEAVHTYSLTDLQVDYLLEISRPNNGGKICSGIDDHSGRDVAPYQEAIKRLQELDLMDYGDQCYELTTKGWAIADQVWAPRILDALTPNTRTSDGELCEAVGLTEGQDELHELRRHLAGLEDNEFIDIHKERSGWHARIIEKGMTYRRHRPIMV